MLRLGATGLESDVWLTADGVPVLDHDGVVRTGLRRRKLSTFGRDSLPSHIPTLADLIVACGSAYELSLDLQQPDVGPVVVDTIKQLAPELLPRCGCATGTWTFCARCARSTTRCGSSTPRSCAG